MVRRLEGYRLLGCRFDLDKSIFFGTIEEPERGLWNELFVDLTACHTYNLTYLSVYSPKALIHRADSGSAYCHGSPSSLICFFSAAVSALLVVTVSASDDANVYEIDPEHAAGEREPDA